jgi:hypothetical protein
MNHNRIPPRSDSIDNRHIFVILPNYFKHSQIKFNYKNVLEFDLQKQICLANLKFYFKFARQMLNNKYLKNSS